ncbi:MAG TPA: 30S ribosome-binding factor RbfA [Opitutus sp.]|nr:30S ribosome-binding factor RbfA [Opitutus sp.]
MSNRTLRVNELIQRELSDILRKRYQSEAVAITITEVRVAPDLRDARVFVSVIGNEDVQTQKLRWLKQQTRVLQDELSRRIVLKYMPRFQFVADHSVAQGTRILQMLDEIGGEPAPADDSLQDEPSQDEPPRA